MLKNTFYILLLAGLFCPGLAFADSIAKPTGWVNDHAGVISPEYRDKITALIDELDAKTGAEIFVVTAGSIAPYDEKEYARRLFDSWKPGKKGKDNGVLVLLAIKERRWRIEAGYGIEGILPDGRCCDIGRDYMAQYFKAGDYGKGLYSGVGAIAETIAGDAHITLTDTGWVRRNDSTVRSNNLPAGIITSVFLFFFFFVWNIPWPVFIGLPFTLIFAIGAFKSSAISGLSIIMGYAASMLVRFFYWNKLPAEKRRSFFGPQAYGGTYSGGSWGSGGFGGGGFGGGGGGCGGGGGGCGGGGGGGGGF